MKTINIKNQELKISWNAKSFYLFGKNGGNIEEITSDKNIKNSACSFANIVILVWAMLDSESRAKYPSPEELSELFLPLPSQEAMASINQELIEGNQLIS